MQAHSKLNNNAEKHFGDWPNAAAFNNLEDTKDQIELEISGHFPTHVAGTLCRTGPGAYKVPRSNSEDGHVTVDHWFDGFTTTHRFELTAGENGACNKVFYSSYNQTDDMIDAARRTGKLDGITFGQKRDPCDSFYKKFKAVFEPNLPDKSVTSINIGVGFQETLPQDIKRAEHESGKISGRRVITTTTDNHATKTFDADTLEPLGVTRQDHLHPSLTGPLSCAHPAYDAETGHVFNYNIAFGARQVYRVFRANTRTGDVEILAEIAGRDIKAAYIHSISMTDNFIVLCIWPAHFKGAGASLLWERNLMDAMADFDPNAKAIWLVIDRRHGRGLVKKFESPAFFCFHTTNAWEQPSNDNENAIDIIWEACTFPNLDILHRLYYQNLVSTGPGASSFACRDSVKVSLTRYKLANIPASKSKSSTIGKAQQLTSIPSPKAGDLPNINPNYRRKPHRYVWSLIDQGKSSFNDSLGKTDTQTGECVRWECYRHTPSEPIFLPLPGAVEEDEGHVLTVVFDGETGRSYLLCLDARTMREVGRAEVGKAVGIGFHGLHVPVGGGRVV